MSQLNIFETIGNTTNRFEPFHSRFLADALVANLDGRRSLFDGVWSLCAPICWEVPVKACVYSEYELCQRRKIDILIKDVGANRAVGIEVKTTSTSAEPLQLETYYRDLKHKNFVDVAIAYLTPFNKDRVGNLAVALDTTKRFNEFKASHSDALARHVSWLEVAEINWEGNELWRQHQRYVRHNMASLDDLRFLARRDRSLDYFFGDVIEIFWKELFAITGAVAKTPVVIDLEECYTDPISIAAVFEILINDEYALPSANRENSFPKTKRDEFRKTEKYGAIHDSLFKLTRQYQHVWVRGKTDYGLCMANRKQKGKGVSLVRSDGKTRLVVGELR